MSSMLRSPVVKFSQISEAFALIEPVQSRLEITRMLAELLRQATPSEASMICNLSLGQLQPPYIGTQFNIAEKTAIKAVAELLDLDAQEIGKRTKVLGDLGSVVAEGTWHPGEDLTVHQVFARLEEIEQISGTGSLEHKVKQLSALLRDLDKISAKYLIRIIVGQLRLGFSDMTLIDALSWMVTGDKSLRSEIENAYNVCADIGFIAQTLKQDGIEGIKTMHVHVGIPIRPAAAERLPHAQAIIDKIGACIAEPKVDGFRLQIHIDNTKSPHRIAFFSRNMQDMSHMFPDLTEVCSRLSVDSIICEGEAIAYDPHTQSYLPFQETVKRKRKHGISQAIEEYPLRVFIFDVLYLNGQELLSEPYLVRRKKLSELLQKADDETLLMIQDHPVDTVQELEEYFYANLAAGLEGVVVKRPYSQYTPGKRNFNWIKLKRQEEGHLEDTIDCVVLGYYAGSGKRASFGIGAFLVGVFNQTQDCYETIAKIGTGLTDQEWRELKIKCDSIAVVHQPKNVMCAKDLFPDVWVAPEIVCSVRADEITLSPVHSAGKIADKLGFALRFPRIMGYREDKAARDATTVKEVESLFENQLKR